MVLAQKVTIIPLNLFHFMRAVKFIYVWQLSNRLKGTRGQCTSFNSRCTWGSIWGWAPQTQAPQWMFPHSSALRHSNHATRPRGLRRLSSLLVVLRVQPCFTISKLIQEAYFSWYMPQASCYYGKSNCWSETFLGPGISNTNTPVCILDKNRFALIQPSYKSSYCLHFAWVIF